MGFFGYILAGFTDKLFSEMYFLLLPRIVEVYEYWFLAYFAVYFVVDYILLLEAVKASQNTGVYFLDIELKCDMNGMKLAQQIRMFDPRCFIIFVTSHLELSCMTFQYRVEAMDFVFNDNPAEARVKIRECLLNALERYTLLTNKVHKTYTIEIGERKIIVDYDAILFFETSSNIHKVILHAKDRQIEFSGTMKDLEKALDDSFVRCYRSFLANRKNIKEVDMKKRII